jgi:hypothetical protein
MDPYMDEYVQLEIDDWGYVHVDSNNPKTLCMQIPNKLSDPDANDSNWVFVYTYCYDVHRYKEHGKYCTKKNSEIVLHLYDIIRLITSPTNTTNKVSSCRTFLSGDIAYKDLVIEYELFFEELELKFIVNNVKCKIVCEYSLVSKFSPLLIKQCKYAKQFLERKLYIDDIEKSQLHTYIIVAATAISTAIATALLSKDSILYTLLSSAYELIVSVTLYVPYIL